MIKKVLYASTTVATAAIPNFVSALGPEKTLAVCSTTAANFFGIQPWYACLPKAADGSPQVTKLNDIFLVIFPLVDSLIKIGALVAAGIIFFMLIQIIIARGNAGKIATSIEGIKQAVIGFIICLVSIALVNFVSGAFQ